MARTYIRDWRGRFARTPGPKPNRHTRVLKADLIVQRQQLVEDIHLLRERHRAVPSPLAVRAEQERDVFAEDLAAHGLLVIV